MSYNNYLFLGGRNGGLFWLLLFVPLVDSPSRALLSHFRSAFWKSKTPTGPADVFAFASCS